VVRSSVGNRVGNAPGGGCQIGPPRTTATAPSRATSRRSAAATIPASAPADRGAGSPRRERGRSRSAMHTRPGSGSRLSRPRNLPIAAASSSRVTAAATTRCTVCFATPGAMRAGRLRAFGLSARPSVLSGRCARRRAPLVTPPAIGTRPCARLGRTHIHGAQLISGNERFCSPALTSCGFCGEGFGIGPV
jgi:hypothetical protein